MTWVRDSGLSEDTVSNVWYASNLDDGTPGDATQYNSLSDALNTFYNSLSDRYAAHLGTTRTMKIYDLEDSQPRVPVYEESYTPTAPTNQGFPGEVALCLSFQGEPASGVNQARRRGRVFLGPLAMASANTSEVSGDTRPSTATITAIDSAYTALRTAWDGVGIGWDHVAFSQTLEEGGTPVHLCATPVGEAWVDNAYDTQRKRGAKATLRNIIWEA